MQYSRGFVSGIEINTIFTIKELSIYNIKVVGVTEMLDMAHNSFDGKVGMSP